MQKQSWLGLLPVLLLSTCAVAQTPGVLYNFNAGSTAAWTMFDSRSLSVGNPPVWNRVTMSAASGDLVLTEIGSGTGGPGGTATDTTGVKGGPWFVAEAFNYPMESSFYVPSGSPYEKGNLDVTGLQYIELDIKNNLPVGQTLPVDFLVMVTETENVNVPSGPAVQVGNTVTTLRFPISLLTPRQQTNVKSIVPSPQAHTNNVEWTISEVRTVGTPLVSRSIVTNNAGSPDDGIDGAFPMNTADMLAIVDNPGSVSQVGFSRNPAGTGSLQWTDKGGTGTIGSESGASIGWGDGSGWRNAQPGTPTSGNSYNERVADFSNYNRMTVRISAQDLVNPAGNVDIQGVFAASNPDGDSAADPIPATLLANLSLPTDGQYHDLVFDLSTVQFLKNVWHWGLDVAAHPNNIVFNIDNIQLWRTDYNLNSQWDTPDYVLWRKTPDSFLGNPGGYSLWRAHYGESAPGSGSGLTTGSVPEPSTAIIMISAAIGILLNSRRKIVKIFPQ